MSHSDIVKELLHKLSKNELLQDGGKSNYYRSQLNNMIGRGHDEDTMTQKIIGEINQLIPLSVLNDVIATVKVQITELKAEKVRLIEQVRGLDEALSKGTANQQQMYNSSLYQQNFQDQLAKQQQATNAAAGVAGVEVVVAAGLAEPVVYLVIDQNCLDPFVPFAKLARPHLFAQTSPLARLEASTICQLGGAHWFCG
jgi:hypothetical protein